MRVTTNTKMIQRRARLGKTASLAGIAVLAAGMFASFRQELVWLSFAALLIGFFLAQFGTYNLRRWGRSPRPDQVLEESMKGFDDRYHFYSWSLPVPFVLLSPLGLYVFTTRDQTGQITVNGSTWRTKLSLGRILMFFGQEGMGNPTEDARAQAARLTEWIRAKLPDTSVTAQPLIVFIDARAQLDVTDPVVPVLDPKGIKKWLRSGRGDGLKPADLKAVEAVLDQGTAR